MSDILQDTELSARQDVPVTTAEAAALLEVNVHVFKAIARGVRLPEREGAPGWYMASDVLALRTHPLVGCIWRRHQ